MPLARCQVESKLSNSKSHVSPQSTRSEPDVILTDQNVLGSVDYRVGQPGHCRSARCCLTQRFRDPVEVPSGGMPILATPCLQNRISSGTNRVRLVDSGSDAYVGQDGSKVFVRHLLNDRRQLQVRAAYKRRVLEEAPSACARSSRVFCLVSLIYKT
jgi:hypothetical protein